MKKEIPSPDLETIVRAKQALEKQTIAVQLTKFVGKGTDQITKRLPDSVQHKVAKTINVTLTKATEWAFLTTGTKEQPVLRNNWIHNVAVIGTGALGGSLGLTTTLWELPVSTTIMLRNIGCIAEEEGLDMSNERTRLGCVSVLAMGGDSKKIEGEELGYWVTRQAMAELVSELLSWTGKGAAPALARFIMTVAGRFGIVISEKTAVQFAPGMGAFTGALINTVFLNHYQEIARAHFSLERLCLQYGDEAVKAAYAATA